VIQRCQYGKHERDNDKQNSEAGRCFIEELRAPPAKRLEQRMGELLAGKRAITADTGLRLCRFFGLANGWWLGPSRCGSCVINFFCVNPYSFSTDFMNFRSIDNSFIAETRAWVERVVVGLKLCPFAPAPVSKGLVRYVTTDATTVEALLEALITELQHLATASPDELETTLLIHPRVLHDFYDYNDFLTLADEALYSLGFEGQIQLASFHPQYQFSGTEADDLSNATNRSPYPTLHLLREESIGRAVDSFGDTASISQANMATFEKLGREGWVALQRRCREAASVEK
jgi:hypothetical protein